MVVVYNFIQRLLFITLSITFILQAQEIDVLIKGIDDGIRSNKQQDRKEAVMNAKLEAMERAGSEIQSITKIVNFQMKYNSVESKAEAILLPGYEIMDIGYQSDGTYQIVLSGKIFAGNSDNFGKEYTLVFELPFDPGGQFYQSYVKDFIRYSKIFIDNEFMGRANEDLKFNFNVKAGKNKVSLKVESNRWFLIKNSKGKRKSVPTYYNDLNLSRDNTFYIDIASLSIVPQTRKEFYTFSKVKVFITDFDDNRTKIAEYIIENVDKEEIGRKVLIWGPSPTEMYTVKLKDLVSGRIIEVNTIIGEQGDENFTPKSYERSIDMHSKFIPYNQKLKIFMEGRSIYIHVEGSYISLECSRCK